jgi:hypothetical protein
VLKIGRKQNGDQQGTELVMVEEIVNYGAGTNVLCKACRQRKIFASGPTPTTPIPGGGRYIMLKCPSPSCGRVERYGENELEIH